MSSSFSSQNGFEKLTMLVSDTTITFKKEKGMTGKNVLVSKRETGEFVTYQDTREPAEKKQKAFLIYGLLGTISLNAGIYFAVVTGAEPVCEMRGNTIWKTKSFMLQRNAPSVDGISIREAEDDLKYISLLENYLNTKHFYFSYQYDLSNPIAKQPTLLKIETCNAKFVFNQQFLSNFAKVAKKSIIDEKQDLTNFNSFCLPIIQGFVQVKELNINENSLKIALLSRRSVQRSGTRYHCRGGDDQGNVANFVETEQILISDEKIFSFLMIRGSIPLAWSQQINMKYKPRLFVNSDSVVNLEILKNHVNQLTSAYGKPILFVNLVNKSGYERPLGEEMTRTMEQYEPSSDLKYFHFDFHHECRAFGWSRLNDLIGSVKKYFEQFGYYECSNNLSSIFQKQIGIVRVNCVDSLDRTNVFLGLIGKSMLLRQLKQIELIEPATTSLEKFPFAENTFKNIWADNGDFISELYTGTAALKSDFTRTGKRSLYGLLNDGFKSIKRYYLNNYEDAQLEDATALLSGSYSVKRGLQSPFKVKRNLKKQLMIVVLVYLALLFLYYFLVKRNFSLAVSYLLVIFCFFRFVILKNGRMFVAIPHLSSTKSS